MLFGESELIKMILLLEALACDIVLIWDDDRRVVCVKRIHHASHCIEMVHVVPKIVLIPLSVA